MVGDLSAAQQAAVALSARATIACAERAGRSGSPEKAFCG